MYYIQQFIRAHLFCRTYACQTSSSLREYVIVCEDTNTNGGYDILQEQIKHVALQSNLACIQLCYKL